MIQQRQDLYAAAGLTSILVIEEGSGGPATSTLCKQIRTKYNLTIPVLYDPTQALKAHFAFAGANEQNVVLKAGGKITYLKRYASQASEVEPAI